MKIKIYKYKSVPYPKINYLFRFFKKVDKNQLFKTKNKTIFFNYARYAMLYAIKAMSKKTNAEIWLPFYYCKESVDPLKQKHLKLKFYPLNESFEPDYKWLNNQKMNINSIFIYVHYFGIDNNITQAKSYCSEKNLFLIEDAAHLYNPNGIKNLNGDAIIFSPRKFLPLPDGGVLLIKNKYNTEIFSLSDKIEWEILIWYFYKIIKNIFFPRVNLNRKDEIKEKSENNFKSISIFTYKILFHIINNEDSVMVNRIKNYQYLFNKLNKKTSLYKIFSCNKEFAPFVFPIIFNNNANKIFDRLKSKNYPVGRWPDLPEKKLDQNDYIKNSAIKLRDKTIIIPIHQDLKMKNLDSIVNIINEF